MSKNTVITSGSRYTDIDVLACAIAYAELKNATPVLPGAFNATIPESIRKWPLKYETQHPQNANEFIMVDVSNPDYFPNFVQKNQISEVWDHRKGFENYWGNKGHINQVGACATQIFELFGDKTKLMTTIGEMIGEAYSVLSDENADETKNINWEIA